MKGVLVDSNIILDVFLNDPKWADWSESTLEEYINYTTLYINPIIYSEISIGFKLIEDLESAITKAGFQMLEIPKEALFLAGKAYLKYKKRKGVKSKKQRGQVFILHFPVFFNINYFAYHQLTSGITVIENHNKKRSAKHCRPLF